MLRVGLARRAPAREQVQDAGAILQRDAPPGDAVRPRGLRYSDEPVGDDVRLASYLSRSGFTLTVALNYADGTITGVASDGKTWTPVHGSFEVVQ
jgi:hypothetical protein